ncbi:DUF3352 domain-containing protein [Nocardioides marmorisolisilvae]|uniref:DUF3352 domain-containing protein n=1 Tax=Nocardioides marmorisolisilvae TaxID=1542737 RepID=A0A3N0DVT0_9ACTN|nr:DUF3352 domain-containing protein [Nocardioides marmorisolisilvae]RNL79708.1 DUF3352 domain-containing protein [Nocardioides marmorisolisilvae]
MTDAQPPSYLPADSQSEVLGTAPSGGRRVLVIGLVAALVVAVLGSGAWAAYSFLFGGGPQPEEALPSTTVAVVSVDLNPSAGQKINAIKTIRKFPGLKKSLGLNTDDDLRKFIFDKATESGDCKGIDFDKNVKPWIGKRAAFGAVDLGGDSPAPVIALQISDRDKARTGFSRIADCAGAGDDFKWAIGDDYLIASDSQAHADTILSEGQKKSLADDPAYKRWHGEAGDAGVINFYVAKRATKYLSDVLDQLGSDVFGGSADSSSAFDGSSSLGEGSGLSAPRVRPADDPDPLAGVKDQLDKFQGLAGTVRFAGGGMELSFAAGGLGKVAPTTPVGKQVAALPADTVFALAFGVPKNAAENFTEGFKSGDPSGGALGFVEDQIGLRLPEDLQTVLGDSLTLSLGGDAPADLSDIQGFEDIPVGLVIHGDAAKIRSVITKIEDHTGVRLSDIPIVVAGDDSRVVLSPSKDYADQLSKKGSLGSKEAFVEAVPDAERSTVVAYLDFDSSWRETLLRFAGDDGSSAADVQTADDNTKPLQSLGISSWLDGNVSHVLVKISTD